MSKTHSLRVTTADGVHERTVDAQERLLLKSGGNLQAFKIGDLTSFTVGTEFGPTPTILIVNSTGGAVHGVPRGGRLELGDDKWALADIASFRLALIPPKVEEQPAPPSRTWRIVYRDPERPPDVVEIASGRLDGRIYDLTPDDGFGWNEGRAFGPWLDDVATIERVEPAEPESPVPTKAGSRKAAVGVSPVGVEATEAPEAA